MPPHGRLSRTYVTPHVTLTSLSRPRSPTHGPRRPHAAGHGHVLGRDTDIMQTCHVTGTGRGGPTTLDIVRADGEREAIANAPAPACTRSRWSIRRHFDISPALAPVRSATTSCPPNVHPSTSLRPDPRSSLATSAYDASPRPDYTYDQRAVGVTSVYEDIRRLHDDTGDLLMQLRRRRRPIRPLRRCGQHVYDPRSTRHRIAARFSAPEPPTHFTHPCFCEPTNSQVLPIGPAVLMAGDRYTYAGNDPVNVVDPLGLWGWNPISDATQAWNDTGGKAASYVAKHHQIIEQVATVAVVGLATAACIAATDGLCAAALPLIGAATNTAVYEEGGGQHTLAGAAQAFGEGGLVGSLALVCVAACEIAGGILAGGALVNGLVGAGQGIWDYSQSTGCHSATGYAKAGADGFGQGAIPWDSIWKGIAGGGGDG